MVLLTIVGCSRDRPTAGDTDTRVALEALYHDAEQNPIPTHAAEAAAQSAGLVCNPLAEADWMLDVMFWNLSAAVVKRDSLADDSHFKGAFAAAECGYRLSARPVSTKGLRGRHLLHYTAALIAARRYQDAAKIYEEFVAIPNTEKVIDPATSGLVEAYLKARLGETALANQILAQEFVRSAPGPMAEFVRVFAAARSDPKVTLCNLQEKGAPGTLGMGAAGNAYCEAIIDANLKDDSAVDCSQIRDAVRRGLFDRRFFLVLTRDLL